MHKVDCLQEEGRKGRDDLCMETLLDIQIKVADLLH